MPASPAIFETHCHLNHSRYDDDVEQTLQRARDAGVTELINIGWNLEYSRRAVKLADPAGGVYAAVGFHPHDAEEWDESSADELRSLAAQPGVVAIGEIGLDFFRDLSPRPDQYAAFHAQMELALELGLPVVIHTRDSMPEALEVLEPYAARGATGVLHCWSGTVEQARQARGMGFLLGIGGVVTYKNPGYLREVVLDSPLESLLLETDCPYLTPMPHRGRRNEPSYLPLILACVASLRGETPEEVAAATRANAQRLFRLFR